MMDLEFPLPSGGFVTLIYGHEWTVCIPVDATDAQVSEMMEVARLKADECDAHYLQYLYDECFLPQHSRQSQFRLSEEEQLKYRQDAALIHTSLGLEAEYTCNQIYAIAEKSELYSFGKSLSAAKRKTLGLNLNTLTDDSNSVIEHFRMVRDQYAPATE